MFMAEAVKHFFPYVNYILLMYTGFPGISADKKFLRF